jgi:hypothetical protein
MKAQAKQAEQQADQQFQMQKFQAEQQALKEKWDYDMRAEQQTSEIRLQEITAEAEAKLSLEKAQALFNIEEERNETEESNKREQFKHDLAMELLRANTAAQAITDAGRNNGD